MSEEKKSMFLYVGTYADETAAGQDFDNLMKLRDEGWVGTYDAGIVSKDSEGKVNIKRSTDSTGKGVRRGLVIGVLAGIVFPPSVLAGGLVGAGTGAAIGHSFNEISKDDLKGMGEALENNQSVLVVIGESKVEEMVRKAVKQAVKEYKKEFNADVKQYNEELDKMIKEI